MRRAFVVILLMAVMLGGCRHHTGSVPEQTYSHYAAPNFPWGSVARVLVLPLDNETTFPHATEEVQNALTTELQRLGLFEVVPAPPSVPVELCRVIRENGRFNEAILIQLARQFQVDAVLMGTLTQYSPYSQPRVGMVLQVVSPGDAAVVASIDGVWDSANKVVADRARAFYLQYFRPNDQSFAADLVLDSPRLYQRYVCAEAVHVLVWPIVPPLDLSHTPGRPCPDPPVRLPPAPPPLPPTEVGPLPQEPEPVQH